MSQKPKPATGAAPPPPTTPAVVVDSKSKSLVTKAKKYHDGKRYKLAIKTIDGVLRKYPKYGEAVALKGFTLLSTAEDDVKRADALDQWIRRGLRMDQTCADSWRYYAQGSRQLRRYRDALDAWAHICKTEKRGDERYTGLREMATLQAQLRLFPEHLETRLALLMEYPKMDAHWAGAVVANHFLGRHKIAMSSLEELRIRADPRLTQEQRFDLSMYRAQILSESGDAAGALDFLADKYPAIGRAPVPGVVQERQGELMLKLGRFDDARTQFLRLIDAGSTENCDFHRGYQCAILKLSKYSTGSVSLPSASTLTPDERKSLADAYAALRERFPKSFVVRICVMELAADADAFRASLDALLRDYIARGVPSLFSCVRPMYPRHAAVIQELVAARVAELRASAEGEHAKAELAWALYFLAQHHDKVSAGSATALSTIEEAIELLADPSERLDLVHFKARVLKHMGDIKAAAETMDEARKLDLNDRYINNKTVKYMIRASQKEPSLATAALFIRSENDTSKIDAGAHLHDLQCCWFANEQGFAAAARHASPYDVVEALKAFSWIKKHFDQYEDDQMDFHDYSLRRIALLSYTTFVKYEDTVRRGAAFRRAASACIPVLLRVLDYNEGAAAHDEFVKSGKDKSVVAAAAATAATATAASGAKDKDNKTEAAKEDEEDDDAAAAAAVMEAAPDAANQLDAAMAGVSGDRPVRRKPNDIPPDPDPMGWKYYADVAADPLKEAKLWSDQLVKAAFAFSETHLLAFDVEVRSPKRDLDACVKSLAFAVRLLPAGTSPLSGRAGVVERLAPFARFAALGAASYAPWCPGGNSAFVLEPAAATRLEGLCQSVFGQGKVPLEVVTGMLASGNDGWAVLSAARALLRVDVGNKAALDALGGVVRPLPAAVAARNDVFPELQGKLDKAFAEAHRAKCLEAWPRAKDVLRVVVV